MPIRLRNSCCNMKKAASLDKNSAFPLQGDLPTVIDILTPSGSTIPVEFRSIRSTWAQRPAFMVSLHDLTKRRAVQEALLRAQSAAKLGSWSYCLDTDQANWSPEMYRIFDLDPEKDAPYIRQHPNRINPADYERINRKVSQAMEQGLEFHEVFQIIRSDKSTGWAEIIGQPLWDQSGRLTHLTGTVQDITKRVSAEEELQRHQKILQRTERIAKIGGWELDPKSGAQKWTKGAYSIHEVDREFQPCLDKCIMFYAPDARPVISKALDDAIKHDKPFSLLLPLITAKGRHIWVRTKGRAHFRNGVTEKISGTIQDITKHKEARDAMQSSRAELESLLHNVKAGVVVYGPDAAIKACNQQAAQWFGLLPQEIIGKRDHNPLWSLLREDGSEMPFEEYPVNLVLNSGLDLEDYVVGIRRSGHEAVVWVLLNAKAVFDKLLNLTQVIVSCIDITERKSIQEDINRLAAIVESSQDAIIGMDLQYRITAWNSAAERIYGYSAQEALGKHISLIVPHEKLEELNGEMACIRRGQALRIYETMRRRKDGGLVDVSLSVSPVVDSRGVVTGAATIAHVITELKQARAEKEKLQNQLRHTQKMEAIGVLAGGIAHDFNNIIAMILGFAELTLRETDGGTEAAENIKAIISASNRAKDLTNQILTFCRVTEQKRSPLDLGNFLKEALKMIRASLPSSIKIKYHIPSNGGKILADSSHIHQIIMNLCANAAQAMEDSGGTLSLVLEEEEITDLDTRRYLNLSAGRYYRLNVSDTGEGIAKEIQDRIFEPFFTTKSAGKGTGMGLATVHGIIKQHGGAITVFSEPAQGTTFQVYLPMMPQASPEEQIVKNPDLPRGKDRILFVDDEPSLVKIGVRSLSNLGYTVASYTSSLRALEAFMKDPGGFDLLITDLTMPNLTGVQLAEKILEVRPDMPIIMCTGFSERITQESAHEIGIAHLAIKPIMASEMARIIADVMKKGRARQVESNRLSPDMR